MVVSPKWKKSYLRWAISSRKLPMATVPLQLHLGTQTGFITREDGLQVISTLKPLESPSCQTLWGKNFTSDWIHGQRIMSSHLETEIIQSSGKVLHWSLSPVNIFPEACGIEATTKAVTAHVKCCLMCSTIGILGATYTITLILWLAAVPDLWFQLLAQRNFPQRLMYNYTVF